jgi:hypothetical protein
VADSDGDGLDDGEDPDVLASLIQGFPSEAFKSPSEGTRRAFLANLEAVEANLLAGNVDEAINKLESLRRRVDGCEAPPPLAADGNDWIVTCSEQNEARALIDLLLTNLGS